MQDKNETVKSKRPAVLLTIGVLAGLGAAILNLAEHEPFAGALAATTAIIAIWLAFIIARRQDEETSTLRGAVQKVEQVVDDMHELLRSVAERDSAQDYEGSTSEAGTEELPDSRDVPAYEEEAIASLRAHGAKLDYDNLLWRAKEPMPPLPGNHGWFVESPNSPSGGRWFVRKARGMTVRKAMPREFLDTLEQEAGLDPRTIKLDFQVKQHGLAAWYARTYDGKLWRVWRSSRNAAAGVQVKQVDEDV